MFTELFLLAITLYIVWTIKDNYFPDINHPPGPLRLPFIGILLTFIRKRRREIAPFLSFRDLMQTYGPIAYFSLGPFNTVLIDDFDTVKTVLNSEIWVDRPFPPFISERSYGRPLGIIFASGESWKEMRRFSMRTLKDFGFGRQTYMQSTMDDELKHLLEKLDKISSQKEPILKVKHLFTMPVLNILWSIVSSVRTSEDNKKLKRLMIIVDNLAKATPMAGTAMDILPIIGDLFPELSGAAFIRKCVKEQQDYFQEVLDSRRKDGAYKEDNRDFIDMFIKEIDKHQKLGSNPNFYDDQQFITTITDLFEAGSETSSNTLEFAIYFAMTNPTVQRKVQEEIDRVVGRSRLPTTGDRPNMPYTEATLMEIQRLANVLPMTVRSPTEDCKLKEYDIAKGSVGMINIYSIHTNKEFWGDPFNFRPERFLDKNNQIISQKASRVIPFGAGKRVCLGEQMARTTLFTYFTALLQSYNFTETKIQAAERQREKSLYENPEDFLFKKVIHVGFTLSPHPYQAKITKRQ